MLTRFIASRRGVRRFVTATCANAVAEYAVILALIVVSGVVAYAVAGASTNRTFAIAARIFAGSEADATSTPVTAGNADGQSARTENDGPENVDGPQRWMGTVLAVGLGIAVWAVLVTIGFLIRRVLRRRWLDRLRRAGGADTIAVSLEPSAYERLAEKRQQIGRLLCRDIEGTAAIRTQVQHLMSRRLAVVTPETLVAEALAVMDKEHIRHLLVCRHTGPLVGIISDRDMKQRLGATVSDIMTAPPITVTPETAIGPAITLMLTRNISCLPVVHEGATCGVLTTTDVLLSCQCLVQLLERIASGACLPQGTRVSPPAWTEWDREDDPLETTAGTP